MNWPILNMLLLICDIKIAKIDFMALSAHFHSEEKNGVVHLEKKCLDVVPFPEISHSADNVR